MVHDGSLPLSLYLSWKTFVVDSPPNAFIRDTCTTDRSDHHARRHAAGSTEDPDHAYHLLLDEVEAHGDEAHPGEDVERTGA